MTKSTVAHCGKCPGRKREIRNVSRRLGTAMKKLLSRKVGNGKSLPLTVVDKIVNLTVSNKKLSTLNSKLRITVAQLREEKRTIEQNARFLDNSLAETADALAETRSRIVHLFDGRTFSPETIHAVMQLSAYGVADEKIGGVIECVAMLLRVQIDRVPSASTVRNYALASLTVAKEHASDRFAQAILEGQSVCLYSDETNKKGAKLQLFGAGLVKGDGGQQVFLFGLTQVADKTALTAFDILKQNITSLGRLGKASEIDQFLDRFLASTTCVMSDRASTQHKFNSILSEYRETILPKVVEGWESMGEDEKAKLRVFHTFFCQLHTVANLTNVILEVLAEHERITTGKDLPPLSPTVFTVIKEGARLFGDRSAGMHGCSIEYKAWLGADLTHSSFPSFIGHRFNIVFLLGARIFCAKEKLIGFIDELGGTKPELVRLAELLRLPIVQSHLQILGLIDQLVSAPLWRISEHLEHVLETRTHAQLLLSWVEKCKEDPLTFFSGNSPSPSLQLISSGSSGSCEMLEKLITVAPTESSLEATVLVMEAMNRYFEHMFEDFITDGKYSVDVAEEVVEKTRCASGTNRVVESGFGIVDRLCTHSPNMCVPRKLARVMIQNNHTMDWLRSKSGEERSAILLAARASIPSIRAEDALAKKELAVAILERAHEREQGRVQKELAVVTKRLRAVEGVAISGIVTQIDGIPSLLNSLTGTARVKALCAQIRFRQRGLKQVEPEERIYVLSNKGKPLTEVELCRRLAVLIEDDNKGVLLRRSLPSNLIGCSIRRWIGDESEDGKVKKVEKAGSQTLVVVEFPSGLLSFPSAQFEYQLDEGAFELLDEIL